MPFTTLSRRLMDAASDAGAILMCCNVDGEFCFTYVGVPMAHRMLEHVDMIDPCTNETVVVHDKPLTEWLDDGYVPSHLLMILEALRTPLKVVPAFTTSACIGVHQLKLMSCESFWGMVSGPEQAMQVVAAMPNNQVSCVILPQLATCSHYGIDEAPALMRVQDCVTCLGASTLPSMQEYVLINRKQVLYSRLSVLGVNQVPSVFVSPAGLTQSDMLEVMDKVDSKRDQLMDWADKTGYVLKPTVGACGLQQLLIPAAQTGQRRRGKCADDMIQHILDTSPNQLWILQPFIKCFGTCEYRVFVGRSSEGPKGRHASSNVQNDDTSLMVYAPYKQKDPGNSDEREMSVIYLDNGMMFSEIMNYDGASLQGEAQTVRPWTDSCGLHDKLIQFAVTVRDDLCPPSADVDCMRDVMVRVDILCLFPAKQCEGGDTMYDISNPVLIVNELDNFNAASTMIDIFNPGHDSFYKAFNQLYQGLPHLTNTPSSKLSQFHKHCARNLARLLMQMRVHSRQRVVKLDPIIESQT